MEAHVNVRVDPSSAELVVGQPDIVGFFGVTAWRNNDVKHMKSLSAIGLPHTIRLDLALIQALVLTCLPYNLHRSCVTQVFQGEFLMKDS